MSVCVPASRHRAAASLYLRGITVGLYPWEGPSRGELLPPANERAGLERRFCRGEGEGGEDGGGEGEGGEDEGGEDEGGEDEEGEDEGGEDEGGEGRMREERMREERMREERMREERGG